MNKEEAKKLIRESPGRFLNRDNSGQGYECPFCHSGTHSPDGDGLKSADGIHWTCFARNCVTSADVIEIVGKRDGVSGYLEQLQHCANIMGVTIDDNRKPYTLHNTPYTINITQPTTMDTQPTNQAPNIKHKGKDDPTKIAARKAFIDEASKKIESTDYRRGLSLDTLKRFGVGFCEAFKAYRHNPDDTFTEWTSPRLIIPTGGDEGSYLARDTRPESDIPDEQKESTKLKRGPLQIFNKAALWQSEKPVFIVEGEIDAMSIVEVGGEAIGLGGTSGVKSLLQAISVKPPNSLLIVALDNDGPGATAATNLVEGLKSFEVDFVQADVCLGHKDANEALNQNRAAFTDEVRKAPLLALKNDNVAHALDGFLGRIEESKNQTCYETGFEDLDEALDGGLYSGLYIIGAISSLGKTTFCIQMADQLAQQGHDVLFFSLEMSRDELLAKSVSRLTYELGKRRGLDKKNFKTTRGILTGSRFDHYSETEKDLIKSAVQAHKESCGEKLFIVEGVGNVGTDKIEKRIKRHREITGRTPVVIIDYLQIITPLPGSEHSTDKQNTDRAVLALKRISRDYRTPVIGISSFNRENYTTEVNLTAFKESGAIEYSSDVLLGLQLNGMDWEPGDGGDKGNARRERVKELQEDALDRAKQGKPQSIQVKILKNRNGSKGEVKMDFVPMFNYFGPYTQKEELKKPHLETSDDANPY